MRALGRYFVNRLKEPSTWTAIAVVGTIAGAPPGSIDMAHQLVLGIIGLVGALIPEGKSAPPPPPPPAFRDSGRYGAGG